MSDHDDRDLMERDDDAGDRELYRRREREINSKAMPYTRWDFAKALRRAIDRAKASCAMSCGGLGHLPECPASLLNDVPGLEPLALRVRPRHPCGCYADEPMPERCPHVVER